MVKNSWRYEHPFKLLPGVVLKIIITSSLPCVFVAVVAKISILGYFPKNPIFGYFGILGIFGHFGRSSHFPIFHIFPILAILPIFAKTQFFAILAIFDYWVKMRKIALPPPQGKIVKNSVFYVFVKLGDLGKTVKR